MLLASSVAFFVSCTLQSLYIENRRIRTKLLFLLSIQIELHKAEESMTEKELRLKNMHVYCIGAIRNNCIFVAFD